VSLITIGLNHHTAPIELREKVARQFADVGNLAEQLRMSGLSEEAALISTCNRVELYAVTPGQGDAQPIVDWLAKTGDLQIRSAMQHLYVFKGKEALQHLFRVISSLDSMILGESQIVAQVKEAFQTSIDTHASGPVLHRVMEKALRVAKRVRNETNISREAVSIGRAGVELAKQVLGSLEGRSALLIGAGEHGKLVAKNLFSNGLEELVIANRTFSHGAQLAKQFGGSAIHLSEASRYLPRVDIVLTSIGGGEKVITREELIRARRTRRYRTLVLIDLSVPRVIDSNIQDIDDVFLFDIDDLAQLAEQGRSHREDSAQQAELIVQAETENCWKLLRGERFNDDIGSVFRHAEEVRIAELTKTLSGLTHLAESDRSAIETMSKVLVKKLLHNPISHARHFAIQDQETELQSLLQALIERRK
jgi:glutamyl-tRNA reductase